MKTLQQNIDDIYEVTNNGVWVLTAKKGNYNRYYKFEKYEILQKTYKYLSDNGWELTIKIY